VVLWRRVSIFRLGQVVYRRKREDGSVQIAINLFLAGDGAQPDQLLVLTQLGQRLARECRQKNLQQHVFGVLFIGS
jgi:hypothetical protein